MLDVIFSRHALADLRALGPDARRVHAALEALARGAPNVDVRPLVGVSPWLRLRSGDLRVLLRRLPRNHPSGHGGGWFVARVVNRRDLDRAARGLRVT